jgi:hypothetical protein
MRDDFAPNEDRQRLSHIILYFVKNDSLRFQSEIEFRPEGSNTSYAIDGDYAWNLGAANTVPFSFTSFTYRRIAWNNAWQPVATALDTLIPYGDRYLKIRNGGSRHDRQAINAAAYPGLFGNEPARFGQSILDLRWLLDSLLAIAYEADVLYAFAPS